MPNKDCPNKDCTGNQYNYDLSTSYFNTKKTEMVNYIVGFIKGTVSNDHFSLTPSVKTQANYVNFISVYESKDFGNLESDGILGLSPYTEDKGNGANLFVYELKRDRVIENAIFSVFLGQIDSKNKVETTSKILFGGWDKYIVDESY